MSARANRALWVSLAGLLLAAGGCAFGPAVLERSHGQYAAAVVRVDEEQFLKNIVRLRYVEAPRELDVAAIAAQYELSASAEARPFFSTEATGNLFRSFEALLPFAGVNVANRPTVSLTPQDDASVVRQFLTPISADTLVFLAQAGWPAGRVLRIWVDRINGVPNWFPGGPIRNPPPDFQRFRRATALIQRIQDWELASIHTEERTVELSGPLPPDAVTAEAAVEAAKAGLEYRPREDGKTWALIERKRKLVLQVHPSGLGTPEFAELAALLNLVPGRELYELVVATGMPDPAKNPVPPSTVLQLAPRSTEQALFYLANGVEVPPEHLACGLVRLPEGASPLEATEGIFRIRVSKGHKHKLPCGAYIAVWYRDHWFYVDDRDQETKATLLLMLQLRRLDFKRQVIGAIPALTLPIGR